MHVPKSGQRSFSQIEAWLYPQKVERLKESWAGPFREFILPMLIEAEKKFARFYSRNMGAPNKPVSVLLGILLLKELNDLTDREALQNYEFSMQWHYALDTTPNDAHICEKTLFNFRNRIPDKKPLLELFNDVVKGIIGKWSLETGTHRLDSSVIMSNMKILSRLGLFMKTIEGFLNDLKKDKPGVYAGLDEKYKKRYVDRKGYFADAKPSESRRRLQDCARDLCELVSLFRLSRKIRHMRSFKLMERVLEEHVNVKEDEDGRLQVWVRMPEKKRDREDSQGEVAMKDPKESGGETLQNPSDPDATYSGHKGPGYKVQVMETCDKDNPFQVIDNVSVGKANESDQKVVEAVHEELKEKGIEPKTTFADSGYVSGENIVKAREQGVDLVGPLPGGESKKENPVEVGDFEFNEDLDEVKSCPGGQSPVEQEYSEESGVLEADFDAEKCKECPHSENCPTKKKKRVRRLRVKREDIAKSKRRREEKTVEFKEKYKIRSGIEATISHLKNDLGMKRLSIRGSPSVNFRVIFKVLAYNIRQMSNYVLETIRKGAKTPQERTI